MCGRTCCTLNSKTAVLACQTLVRASEQPVHWREAADSPDYRCLTNATPGSYLPVLVQASDVGLEGPGYVVQPMLWGMVPFWHHSTSPTGHGYSTNNARLEGLPKSRLYSRPLARNQRCVVVCDGFYEWKTIGKVKQPYLVYASQKSKADEDKLGSLHKIPLDQVWTEKDGWIGPKPICLAALFSTWSSKDDLDGKNLNYSYSIITRESNDTLKWLHERMPAILASPEAVLCWLDPTVKGEDALQVLTPTKAGQISWHLVSSKVNNAKNTGDDLAKRVTADQSEKAAVDKQKQPPASSSITRWLKRGPDKSDDQDDAADEDEEQKKQSNKSKRV